MTFREQLVKLRACHEARQWVENKSLEEAWLTCEKSEWMIWVLMQTNLDLVDPLCTIVESVLNAEPEQICLNAIKLSRQRASTDELYIAAGAVSNDTNASYLHRAAGALARYAARCANIDAYAAASYAVCCVDVINYDKERKNQCDILREYFTVDQVRAAFNKLVD